MYSHSGFTLPLVLLFLGVFSPAASAAFTPSDTSQTDLLAEAALANLTEYMMTVQSANTNANANSNSNSTQPTCTPETATRRKEWSALTQEERIAYTTAVQCLTTKPSRHDPAQVPGAKSRYDDFVVVHMNQSLTIHGTASFLTWHRVFTAYFETALREECGLPRDVAQPYWNWGKYAHDLVHSPLFDGGVGSMGSNGAWVPHNCSDAFGNGMNCIPAGSGGGCLTGGPFANMSVNLGPIALTLNVTGGGDLSPVASGRDDDDDARFFAYNPRCIRRDVSQFVSARWTTDQNSTDLLTQSGDDLAAFQTRMQGNRTLGDYGVHGGGHFTVSGDPGGDFYISPGDPVFWLHHAQIDRTWWMWQNQDPERRTHVVAGHRQPVQEGNGSGNEQSNPLGTLEDSIDMGLLGPSLTISEASSSVGMNGSPFCYVYE